MRTHLSSRKETSGVGSSHGQEFLYRSRELALDDGGPHEITHFSSELLSGASDSVEELRSWLSPLCDCYCVAICFRFFPVGRSSGTAFMALGFQPDFFQAMVEMVLDMAWFPFKSVVSVRVGYRTS